MFRGYANKFNRGEIDSQAMAREDVEKVYNAGSYVNNFMPFLLGGMIYRPGVGEYLGTTAGEAVFLDFVGATDDAAALELTNNLMRVWVDDALITRTAVTSTITNGTFTSNITSWTNGSGSGSTAAWATGGYASLTGTGATKAQLSQTIASTDTGNEHALRIVIERAPVLLEIGTSGAASSDIFSGELLPGTHSLVFTPGSNITITVSNNKKYAAYVDSIAFESAGTFSLPTSVATAALGTVRYKQSADVIYCAYNGGKQFQIERRGTKSWSVVEHRVNDGPFNTINNTEISMTAGALSGDTTLTASASYFTSADVGTLFQLVSSGQDVEASVSAEDNGTGSIRVTGVGTSRQFTVSLTGTWVATVTLQRSTDDATWEDVTTYTANTTTTYNDALDNSILYYRLWVTTGSYTSGTANISLSYTGGSLAGICRITAYTSGTVVSVQVLEDFGSTDATRDWYRGAWSSEDGYPTAVDIYEGRLWWAGKTKLWGSVSDAYTSFDTSLEGDSASIQKTIGFGPVDNVLWLSGSSRLIMGLASAEIAIRSNAYSEVLSPTNVNLKPGSTQGSAAVAPVVVDDDIYFVQRSGVRLYNLSYSISGDRHVPTDLNKLNRSICSEGIKRIVVARQPDTRVIMVMDDGTARVFMTDPVEEVSCWTRLSTDGTIEDAIVLPGAGEDRVYFTVNRTGGRYFEKMALFSESIGGTISKNWDSFKTFTSPGTTITVAHLANKTVAVWADGQDRGDYTANGSGQITVAESWTDVVVGLRHTDDWISAKLTGFLPKGGSVLGTRKRVVDTSLIMENYYPGSVKIGPTAALLKAMPAIEDGTAVTTTATISAYDELPFEFDGEDEVDPRIYLQATGPATILAVTYGIKDPRNPSRDAA